MTKFRFFAAITGFFAIAFAFSALNFISNAQQPKADRNFRAAENDEYQKQRDPD